jgi:hypothetical protein
VIDRETILATMRAALEPLTFVDAMWVGGSDAFDAANAHSDVDVMLVVALDALSPVCGISIARCHARSWID